MVGTTLYNLWNIFVAEECGAWPWFSPYKEESRLRSHWLFIGTMDESEEEDEEEDNDSDGDKGGENEEEEDTEAGSEKEEEAHLTALEEERIERKVLGSLLGAVLEAASLAIFGASPGPRRARAREWWGWGIHKC